MREHSFILFQDTAGLWCAAAPGFRDLLHDPAGWGTTRERAVKRLLSRADFQERAKTAGWEPTLRDFIIVPAPARMEPKKKIHSPPLREAPYLRIVR